jgi:type II secretory pathway component GspD/PulD (secretin)
MKRLTVFVGVAFVLGVARAEQGAERLISMRFDNAPATHVAECYSELVGKPVQVETGVCGTVNLRIEESVPPAEALRLIEEALRKQNIGICTTPTNTLVLKWIDASIATNRAQRFQPTVNSNLSNQLEAARRTLIERLREADRARAQRTNEAPRQESPNQPAEGTR